MPAFRNDFGQPYFGFSFRLPIDGLRSALVRGLIWRGFGSVEDVVGTQEQKSRMNFLRGASDVDGAIAIHGKGKVAVRLASIDVGVCGGEDDPIRPGAGKGLRDGFRFADVGIFRTESRRWSRMEIRA